MNEPTNEQIFTMVNFCSIVHWQWLKTDNGDLRWSSVNIWLNLRHLSILTVAQHCVEGMAREKLYFPPLKSVKHQEAL